MSVRTDEGDLNFNIPSLLYFTNSRSWINQMFLIKQMLSFMAGENQYQDVNRNEMRGDGLFTQFIKFMSFTW